MAEFKKKRRKTGGRQKGSQNRITKEVKEAIAAFIQGNLNAFVDTINEIDDPVKKSEIFIKLLPYVVPKQSEVKLDAAAEISAINVQFSPTNIKPIHNENDFIDD